MKVLFRRIGFVKDLSLAGGLDHDIYSDEFRRVEDFRGGRWENTLSVF